MKIVIIGEGKVGSTITEGLLREGHDITIIDSDPSALQQSINFQDIMYVEGNGASYPVQEAAGVADADLIIACTPSDEINMLSCLIGTKLGAKRAISRVRNPEYHDQLNYIREDLGLSMAINPDYTAASEIARLLILPQAAHVDLFAKGRGMLVEVKLPQDSALDGMSLISFYSKYQVQLLVCAVERDNEITIPRGSFIMRAGDKLHITATQPNIERFFKIAGYKHEKVSNVIIAGGSRIAHYLARQLEELRMQVKIIEQDYDQCMELSATLPKAAIVLGDGTSQQVLSEEGLDIADAFVALTGYDEGNMLVSMYAAASGVKKVVTKVNSGSYAQMAERLGLDSVISPRELVANHIISYVRAMQNSLGSNVETLYRLVDGRVEALEFIAGSHPGYAGRPLKELRLKDNLLIGCIVRDSRVIIPNGNDSIQPGDSVLVVTSNQNFQDLSEILD